MNRQILQASASEWVRQAKNDIRNRMNEFMREVGSTRSELAYALGISEGEIAQILEGNGEITLTTFAKLLIATGNVLEIKPIEDSPLLMENGAPVIPQEMAHRMPPMPRGMRRPGSPVPPPPPGLFDDFERQEAPAPAPMQQQPRGTDGRFRPWPRNERPAPAPQHNRPNFATMERERLVEIIQNKLWDTEIDVDNASREQLVHFLEDKDRRMNEIRATREGRGVAIDPSVKQLKDKIKDTLSKNPHLRNYLKEIFHDS